MARRGQFSPPEPLSRFLGGGGTVFSGRTYFECGSYSVGVPVVSPVRLPGRLVVLGTASHDALPLRQLLRPGLLAILHRLQVHRLVSRSTMPFGGVSKPAPPTCLSSCVRCCSSPRSSPPGMPQSVSMTSWGCIPLWVGARGIEFDWRYIQMSLDSNISLVHYVAMAGLVWMFSRYDLPKHYRLPIAILLGLSVYKLFLMESVIHIFVLGSWMALLVKAAVTGAVSLSALLLYVSLVHGN
ncbi:BOS complex subunit TMEM147 isoform X1 [Hemitrygon akajei]|uniref:BOS complex subunit TMEM147 isoform X1 n=1 Tax=Hemitrygon akajei TaxID=2704970 RepID=UPI003BF9BD9A